MDKIIHSLPSQYNVKGISKIEKQGSFGEIYLMRNTSNHLQIVKRVEIRTFSAKEKAAAVEEALILSRLCHPNILSLLDFFLADRDDGHIYMIMEYADCGDLRELIKERKDSMHFMCEKEVQCILNQCCLGLEYIHDRNIIHRDLKSDNIFLHNKRAVVKLGDFGIAKALHSTQSFAKTMVGTPYYFSPELCHDEPYGRMTDIWSLGCVYYELLKLDLPFKAKSLHQLLQSITQKEPEPIPKIYSISTWELVQSMLQKNPLKRPSVKKILGNIQMNSCPQQNDREENPFRHDYHNNSYNKNCIEVIPKQQQNRPNSRCTFPGSWKEVMDEAEKNVVNDNLNDKEVSLTNDSLCVATSLKCNKYRRSERAIKHAPIVGERPYKEGFEKEGINTLVKRLEQMSKDFSNLNKVVG